MNGDFLTGVIHKTKSIGKKNTPINQLECGMYGHFKSIKTTNHWSLTTCKNCLKVLRRKQNA